LPSRMVERRNETARSLPGTREEGEVETGGEIFAGAEKDNWASVS